MNIQYNTGHTGHTGKTKTNSKKSLNTNMNMNIMKHKPNVIFTSSHSELVQINFYSLIMANHNVSYIHWAVLNIPSRIKTLRDGDGETILTYVPPTEMQEYTFYLFFHEEEIPSTYYDKVKKYARRQVSITEKLTFKAILYSVKHIQIQFNASSSVSVGGRGTRKKTPTAQKSFLSIANIQYDTIIDLKKRYKKIVNATNASISEQKWVDNNLSIIIDFMGDSDVWKFVIPDVKLYGNDGTRTSTRNKKVDNYSVAIFTGAHWNSRKANHVKWFEPYDEYQILGTNQFCQTFAMMHLIDKLPSPIKSSNKLSISKYYVYTHAALEFINDVMSKYDKTTDKEKKAIKECMKYPNICLNAIEM